MLTTLTRCSEHSSFGAPRWQPESQMVVAYRDERTWLNLLRLLVGGHHLIFWMIAFALEAARLFGPTVTQLLSSLVVHVSVFERWKLPCDSTPFQDS